ncbi:MAG: hypothetical protein EOM20_09005, partial [Spartobacteria bacterium]|nr:hypothetical protein [Spartobacteria bacterium]
NFSMSYDEAYLIPVLQAISAVNTNLKIMGSPWSPPAWMKDSGNLYHGRLNDSAYEPYAQYFLRFVQHMGSNGLPVHAVTLQNEPLYEPYDYPGMYMAPSNQSRLATLIGQAFVSNAMDTKLLVYDHNWDQFTYPVEVMDDPVARSYIAGSAFHAYAGDVSVQSLIHDAYPDKEIHFTELSSGAWGGGFDNTLIWDTQVLIIGALRHWSRSVLKWNLALDQNYGPKISGGCNDCYGLVGINTDTHAITRNADYYSLGHAAKFLKCGAVRIGCTEESADEMNAVAFRNPDGSLVLIACNPATLMQNYPIRWNGESISYPMPPRSVATFTWPGVSGATVDVWVTSGDQSRLLEEQSYHPVFAPATITWQGHTWQVRDTDGNPGNNRWAADNVFVDSNDCLHLQVKQLGDTWYAAEVLSEDSPGYGTYRWHVRTQPETLHSNLVAGLATFFDAFNGLNIQFSSAFEEAPTNMLYSVEPYYAAGHQYFAGHTFTSEYTTHEFTWNPARVSFRSWYGHEPVPPNAGALIADWTFEGEAPVDTNEHIRMNLWMYDGLPPATAQEFVLAGFHYQSSTGTLFRDDFDDAVISNLWQVYNEGYVEESGGVLRIDSADSDPHRAGCRTGCDVLIEPDGRTFTFSACVASALVSAASSGDADIWGYQAFIAGSNGLYDAYAASNALTLRAGYTLSSDTLRIEFYSKTDAPDQWGTLHYAGVVSNASAFMNNAGLVCTFAVMLTNYSVNISYENNPALVYPISGSETGQHLLGATAWNGRYAVGGDHDDGGRGSFAWDFIQVSADALVVSDSSGGGDDGPGVKEVQIGEGDPGRTWKYPADTTYTKHRSMILYDAGMVDRAGTITQLMLNILSAPGISMNTYRIRMQHSSLDALGDVFINDNWSTVFEDTLTVPGDQQGWFAVPFSTPFTYNGTDHLLVDFCFNNAIKSSTPVPALTYSDTEYAACFAASADKDDPATWTGLPKGRKTKFAGNRMIDIRLTFSNAPLPQVCSNLSFEFSARGFLTNMGGWQVDGSEYAGAIKASPVLHGTNVLKMWKGSGDGHQRVYQDIDVVAGQAYMLNGYLLSPGTEPFIGSNAYGTLRLEWYSAAGLLAEEESIHVTEASAHDVWHLLSVSSAPPVQCVSGRLVCALSSSVDQSGSLYFDKLSLLAVDSDGPTNTPPSSNQLAVAHVVQLSDDFNDTQRSNIWETSGYWDGTYMGEGGGAVCIAPGSNIWHTAAYVSAQPINWNDNGAWYVFSATLSTIRVDVAGTGEDMDSLLAICGGPDNPWWVTNSCSLYGHYDLEADSLRLRFLTKTATPASNGDDRYGGVINNASRYMTPTNHMVMSIALGCGQYEVSVTDRAGLPIPLGAVYGLSRDAHNLGEYLHEGYWFVGAQNDNTHRGAVYWDRTRVFENSAPTAMLHSAQQVSTNGAGLVCINAVVMDSNGDYGRAFLEVSSNAGTSWSGLDLQNAVSTCGVALVTTATASHLSDIATTNADGYLVNNPIVITWDSLGLNHAGVFNDMEVSNLLLRIRPDDYFVSGVAATTTLALLDNAGPGALDAGALAASGAVYSLCADISVTCSNFTDTSPLQGYYYGVNTDFADTLPWDSQPSALVTGMPVDACNTVIVWAVDAYGNVSDGVAASIIVLSEDGDWDEDGYLNAQECIMGTSPNDPMSAQVFSGVREVGDGQCLGWSSVTGRTYTVLGKSSLADEWQVLTNLPGTGLPTTYTNMPIAPGDRYYYRIRISNP